MGELKWFPQVQSSGSDSLPTAPKWLALAALMQRDVDSDHEPGLLLDLAMSDLLEI
jgi:hypothetical protein